MGDILLSGGAAGADTLFALCAKALGHEVYAFSFPGHNGGAGKYDLNPGELESQSELLVQTGKNLNKRFSPDPPDQHQLRFVRNLLLRSAYQILGMPETGRPETVYVVTNLTPDRKYAKGGSSWAVEIAAHLAHDPKLYLFDMQSNHWHTLVEDTFEPCQAPPVPSGIYTGIGARDITEAGLTAIGNLYGVE